MTSKELKISEWELLHHIYFNLVEAGMLLATTDFDDFVEACLTGDPMDFSGLEISNV